jgi:hypothetical protein
MKIIIKKWKNEEKHFKKSEKKKMKKYLVVEDKSWNCFLPHLHTPIQKNVRGKYWSINLNNTNKTQQGWWVPIKHSNEMLLNTNKTKQENITKHQ